MSKNLTFSILGLLATVLAYIFYPTLPELAKIIIAENLPGEFIRLLGNSDLVTFAGFISLFGLSFFILYLVFPVFYIWYQIYITRRIIATLPLISNVTRRTSKNTFLSQLKGRGYIERLAVSYGPYLIQGPEEEVAADALKNVRSIKKSPKNTKTRKYTISPARATVPADVIFNVDSLVNDHLLLGFFTILARIMIGAGVVCVGISMVSLSLVPATEEIALITALQPGLVAFLYLLSSAVIITGFTHLSDLVLSQNSHRLARMINGLFHQNEWQQDINNLLISNAATEQFKDILQDCMDRPLKDIARAVKSLTVEQEKKLDNILSITLARFSEHMESKAGTDMANINKALKDTALAAGLMKKQFTDANAQFSKQMDKQITATSKHLTDMQKVLSTSEKTTQKGAEKIVSSLAAEVQGTYGNLASFMETSLIKLDEKHKSLEKASRDKNGILTDLHKSAKDLGTISNASGMLLERFISLSTELDRVLKRIQENGLERSSVNAGKHDKLKLAVLELKKSNKARTGKLPVIK